MVASWSLFEVDDQSNSQAACPALGCPLLPSGQWFVMLELNPVCYHYAGGYRRNVRGRGPISVRCSWKRHWEERSTEDVVLLGALLHVLPNSVSGSAGLSRRQHLMKRSETRPVMKSVMISGRGDSGGKEFL